MAVRSLVDLSIAKVALQLWNQPIAFETMCHIQPSFRYRCVSTLYMKKLWLEIAGLIRSNAYKLNIPLELQPRLGDVLHQISDGLFDWVEAGLGVDPPLDDPCDVRVYFKRLHNNFIFTGAYDEDQVSTAKAIVADVDISCAITFRIAYENCLEDQVLKLWKDMDKDTRILFINEVDFNNQALKMFWINWAQSKREDEAYHPGSYVFSDMFRTLNTRDYSSGFMFIQNEAQHYFWDKVTAAKQAAQLHKILDDVESSPITNRCDVVLIPSFIFRRLNRLQLETLLDNEPVLLLYSIARHQNTDHLAADLLESSVRKVPKSEFTDVLQTLLKYFYSPTLIGIIWSCSSTAQRRSFFKNSNRFKVYKRLVTYGDHNLLRYILQDSDDSDSQVYSCHTISEHFNDVLCQAKWAILKILSHEYESGEEVVSIVYNEVDRFIVKARAENAKQRELRHLKVKLNEFIRVCSGVYLCSPLDSVARSVCAPHYIPRNKTRKDVGISYCQSSESDSELVGAVASQSPDSDSKLEDVPIQSSESDSELVEGASSQSSDSDSELEVLPTKRRRL